MATAAYQVSNGNQEGAVVAGEGFLVALLPNLIGRLSRTHLPRPLEFAFVLGMALQFIGTWLLDGSSRVLDRHGFPITIMVGVIAAAAIAALWFAGRPLPGLAIP